MLLSTRFAAQCRAVMPSQLGFFTFSCLFFSQITNETKGWRWFFFSSRKRVERRVFISSSSSSRMCCYLVVAVLRLYAVLWTLRADPFRPDWQSKNGETLRHDDHHIHHRRLSISLLYGNW